VTDNQKSSGARTGRNEQAGTPDGKGPDIDKSAIKLEPTDRTEASAAHEEARGPNAKPVRLDDDRDVRGATTGIDGVELATELGQGDVVNPNVPTGQTTEQIASEIPAPDSNLELRRAAEKRAGADDRSFPGGADTRGQVER
jgi:hypothetical protein